MARKFIGGKYGESFKAIKALFEQKQPICYKLIVFVFFLLILI